MSDIINVKTNTKNRLKSLFHNLTYNIMIDKLIWSNYCLKFLILNKIPDINYIENYKKSNGKWSTIKIDGDNKEILDNMRAARYKPTIILSWELGNPDPKKQRTYYHNFDNPTELIIKKKTYDHIINELIDNYHPFPDLSIQGDVGNPVRYAIDDHYNPDSTTLKQHAERVAILKRFSELENNNEFLKLDEDDEFEAEDEVPSYEVIFSHPNNYNEFIEYEDERSNTFNP